MTDDRQIRRWAEARARHHAAAQLLRDAQHELDAATAELVTAGAALAERIRLLADVDPGPPPLRAAA